MASETIDGRPPVPDAASFEAQTPDPETQAQPQPQPAPASQPAPATLRAATYAMPEARITLATSLALSLLWMVCTGPANYSLPVIAAGGIGLTLGVGAFLVTALILRRRAGAPRLSVGGIVLFVLVAGLAIVPSLTSNVGTRVINACILGLSAMVLFLALSGASDEVAFSLRGLGLSITHFFGAQITHFMGASQVIGNLGRPKPSQASSAQGAPAEKRGSIWLGLLAALAILCVVLPLLAEADMVFGSVVGDALSWLADNLGEAAARVLRFLLISALCFALLHSMLLGEGTHTYAPVRAPRVAGSVTIATCVAVLDVVYFIFACVQLVYLFGNTATPDMHGGYADYARSGFFELVAVTFINLVVLAVCIWVRADAERSTVVETLELFLVILTGMILASSLWRMMLYVQKYGLTYQRFLTFFAMAFIAVCLVAGAIRVFVPRFPFFRVAAVAGIAIWLAFGFCGADARIAEHNVRGYLSGQLEEMDAGYLSELSHGAIPALEHLAQESPEDASAARAAIDWIEESYETDLEPWTFWALDCL